MRLKRKGDKALAPRPPDVDTSASIDCCLDAVQLMIPRVVVALCKKRNSEHRVGGVCPRMSRRCFESGGIW